MTRALTLLCAALAVLVTAAPASAQFARVAGQVRDVGGKAIKGAAIRASNPEATPSEFTATSDDKGRWAMIGLRSGNWRFTIEAPGFATFDAIAGIRAGMLAPITVQLVRDLGPLPGALDKEIQKQLAEAHALRDQGRFDQAIAAYQEIRSRNPKLTAMSLVIGNAYRTRAEKEADPAARRTYLERAVESLAEAAKADDASARTKLELASAQEAMASIAVR